MTLGCAWSAKDGQPGFEVIVGGGLGRTPMIGKILRNFLPVADILPYVEAIVSVYNLLGRRDNKYKARIKITVHENGIKEIKARVEARYREIKPQFQGADQQLLREIEEHFKIPRFSQAYRPPSLADFKDESPAFRTWADTNLTAHKAEGYAIVSISLKKHGDTPGDATAAQMRSHGGAGARVQPRRAANFP